MSNLFDNLQKKAFGVVGNTMGVDATWQSSQTSILHSGRVLFNDPSKKYKLLGVDYQAQGWSVEYLKGIFEGLFESVRSGNLEVIVINQVEYQVREVIKEFDGSTYVAAVEQL